MKAKVFIPDHTLEECANQWLAEVGDIFIASTVVLPGRLLVFYGPRRNATTGETKKSVVPVSTKIPRESFPRCPKCGMVMSIRARHDGAGLFWGCPGFPECRGIVNFSEQNYLDCGWLAPEEAGGNYRQPKEEDIPF